MHDVNTAPAARGKGKCVILMSYCVSVPRILTRVVEIEKKVESHRGGCSADLALRTVFTNKCH